MAVYFFIYFLASSLVGYDVHAFVVPPMHVWHKIWHHQSTAYQPINKITRRYSTPEEMQLLEQMRKTLGEKEDIFEGAEKENKQLMQGLRELDRDPNLKLNNRFVEWLGSNGVWVKSESAWGRAPHPLVIASNTEADGESCGRGLLARESLAEGELMMTIPLDLCLSKSTAQQEFGTDVITTDLDEYVAIALLLMQEKCKGEKSRWKPYLDILPDVQQVKPSFIWSEEELGLLKGSPVFFASNSLRSKIEREYASVFENVIQRYPRSFPYASQMTFPLFLWAFVMLLSRAARLTSKSTGEELALVPYADLMNHNPYSNAYIDAQRSGLPLLSRQEEVAVYADRSYKKFEQVFINYGEKGNGDLLLLYGFALDRNPHDSVEIVVGLSGEDPLYEQKKRILERAGRGENRGGLAVRFPLQRGRYPSELVDFLRLLLVERDDLGLTALERIDFNEPLSPSLERRVLSTLISICTTYLEQYPDPLSLDEQLLGGKATPPGGIALTRTQRMAIKLRLSEKRILLQTIQALEGELAKLPKTGGEIEEQGEARGAKGTVAAAGRSFDVLKSNTKRGEKGIGELVEQRGAGVKKTSKEGEVEMVSGSKGDKGEDDEEGVKLSIAERRRRRRMSNNNNNNE